MTIGEFIELLKQFPRDSKIKFSDDNGEILYVDTMIVPHQDQAWDEVVVHITEVE